ncbi:MAG: RHS repeat-associated core domain-containing protein, partial [Pirellulales bacterium]
TDNSAAIAAPVAGGPYTTSYSYDALNRPVTVGWSPAPTQTTPPASAVTFAFGYDPTNRRTSQTTTDNSWWYYPPTTPSTITYSANALNQYTAVGSVTPTYDGDGNLTYDGTFTYGYDAEGRLVSVNQSSTAVAGYAYNAQGRRKSKTVGATTRIYVTDADNREVLEYDGTSGQIENWYAYGLGPADVLNQVNVPAGTRETMIPDVQGSIIGTLDSATGTLTKTGYMPYGESASAAGTFRYTGLRIDPETNGLYYARARMYSPTWGRFLQPDPIGYAAGSNFYAYVNNDPLNNTDPLGLCDNPQGCGAGANAAVLGPELGIGSNITAASANTNTNPLQSTNLEAATGVPSAVSNTSGVSSVETLSATAGEIQLAQATFGHGAGHVPIEVAPGLEGAISRALPPSLPQGIFGKGVIFYGGTAYQFNYYGTGTGVHVGTYYPLQ